MQITLGDHTAVGARTPTETGTRRVTAGALHLGSY
jgi:hypothetical protein